VDDPYAALGVPVEATAPPPTPAQQPAASDAPPAAPADAASPAADPYAQVADNADAPDNPGFTEEQKRLIQGYIPKARDAADLEKFSLEVSGGRSRIGNAQAVLEALHQGHKPENFAWEDPTPRTEETPSAGEQLLDNTVNDVAGIAQGAAALPDMAAEGMGKVLSAIPNLISQGLESAGHGDAAKWVQENITHPLANPPQIGDVVEGISPTPDTDAGKANRLIGQVVGGAAAFPESAVKSVVSKIVGEVPNAIKVVSAAPPSIVSEAKDAGVRVLTSDVKPPRTFVGKAAQAIGERIPITGTGGVREAQQSERVAAVKSLAQDYGATADELASPHIDDVAKDLADTRGALLTKLTAQKNAVIDKLQGAVPVPKAIAAINEQIARLSGINADAYAPVVAKLRNFRDQIASGKTLSQIEGNRKLLGDMFSDPSLASIKTDGEKAVNAIYAPLRDDMGAFIKANGEPADFSRWKGANDALAGLAGNLKNTALKRVLTTAETTPENVARLLFSAKPSDVRLLYDGLSDAGKTKAQSAIIQRAVEKAGGVDSVSPDRFATQIGKLGNQIGVFFSGKDLARVSGLGRVLSATQRASQANLAPPTGVQAVPYAMGAGFTTLFGLPGGISAAAGTGLLARAYESAPVRDLLLKLGRAKPGSSQETMLLKRAASAFNAALRKHVPEALNDNTLSSAAAEPQEQNQQ
jgi:hypothetical protein